MLIFPATGNDFPPKAFEPARYEAIAERDPFGGAIVSSPIPTLADDWSKGLVLRAVTRIEGRYVVHVSNAKSKKAFRLVEGEGKSDLKILSVKPHRDPAQVQVVVESHRGDEAKVATLRYATQKERAGKRVVLPGKKVVLRK